MTHLEKMLTHYILQKYIQEDPMPTVQTLFVSFVSPPLLCFVSSFVLTTIYSTVNIAFCMCSKRRLLLNMSIVITHQARQRV